LKGSSVFCPDCSKVASEPLQPSRYLSRKVTLPKRTPSQSIKKSEPKKSAEKKQRRVGGWILLSALLLLFSAVLVLQGVYIYEEKKALATELSRLQSVEDECVRLTDKLREAEQDVLSLEEELSQLGSDAFLEVRESLKTSEEENRNLTKELEIALQTLTDLEAQMELLREKTEFFDAHIVFLQEDGTNIFHCYDCEKFTRNGYRAYNKQLALSYGYLPCEECQ
ncbi:MAG: hypothetical protein IKM59_03410, partial [Oscillospiraceae bacterium]|nr:hypothetical protein [Oscillospiraceae bacterium]